MQNELTEELRDDAGSHRLPAQGGRRRRIASVAVAGLAAAAVAGVVLASSATGDTAQAAASAQVEAAAQGAVPQAAAPKAKPAATNGYVFQNQRQAVGTLPAGGRVAIGTNHWFQTKGSQWAVVERGQEVAWQATTGIGANRAALNLTGSGAGPVFSTVLPSDKIATIVFTQGKKAWYGKVYKLAGIPGLVEASLEIKGQAYQAAKPGPAEPGDHGVAVFAYDQQGKLLSQFPAKVAPPLGGQALAKALPGFTVSSKADPSVVEQPQRGGGNGR